MEKEKVEEIINKVLEKECWEDGNGYYYQEVYVDYQDNLCNDTIKEILDSEVENSNEKFYDLITDCYLDSEYIFEMEDNLIDIVFEKLDDLEIEYDEDEVRDEVLEKAYIKLPYEHFQEQIIKADLIIDTGDGNYDFTLNNNCYGDFEAEKESALLWLAQTQGYSKEQLERAINNHEYNGSKFLESIADEENNCSSSMNALTFFMNTDLKTLMDIKDNIDNEIEKIIINKNTNCGLVDYWLGSGSMLEIVLEKDIEVPIKYIDSFSVDGDRGSYGVSDIYGMSSSFWNGTCRVLEKESIAS